VDAPKAEADGHAASRPLSLPPIPLLTAPHFTASPTINAGPAFGEQQTAPEGPRFE
jgi:hypothetical protein